ncbi:hypothetical protein ACJZ2D_009170 [Fusarium nematophilum]
MVSSRSLAALVVTLGCCGIHAGPCKPQSSTSLSISLAATTTTDATRSEASESSGTGPWTSTSDPSGETTSTVPVDSTLASTLDTADPTSTTTSEAALTSSSVVSEVPSTDEAGISTSTVSEHSSSFSNVFTTTTSESALISTTTTSDAPATTSETKPRLEFFNGGFEEGGELALPWIIGRSVSIEQDPENARSGNRYALARFPIVGSGRPPFPLRQTVKGLDPTKKYLLTFHWTFHEEASIMGCYFYTYFPYLIEYRNLPRDPPINRYVKRQIVVTPPTVTSADLWFHWYCYGGTDWPGAAIRFDDISVVEYHPPCTSVNAQSEDRTCGRRGYFANTAASSYVIDFPADWISVAFCAQACANTQGCKTFTHSGTDQGLCKLYSATPQQLDFRELANGGPVYEPACFQCRPVES